jgi:hypothetical protein
MLGTDLVSVILDQWLSVLTGFGQTLFELVSAAIIELLFDLVLGSPA